MERESSLGGRLRRLMEEEGLMWAGSLSHNGLTGCGIACGDFMSHKLEPTS